MATKLKEVASATRRDPAPDLRLALAWRDWPVGLREASTRGVPVLCCAEPSWTTAAQRLARNLAATPALADAIESHTVPVWVDAIACPNLAARLSRSSVAAGHEDLPLLTFLTEGGEFLLGPGAMTLDPHGSSPAARPTLLAVLHSLGPRYRAARAEWIAEAQAFEQRITTSGSPDSSAVEAFDGNEMGAGLLPITWLQLSLDRFERDRNPALLAMVTRTLDALIHGGAFDQIGAGFHRGAREPRWILPYFEKVIPQNAAMAALLARAGKLTGERTYSVVAAQTAAFACARLDGKEFVGAIAASSDYYTWTPGEFRRALDPEDAALLGRHYAMTGHDSRHVLFHAPGEPGLDAGRPLPTGAWEQLDRGRCALLAERTRRKPPAIVRVAAVDWIAATVASLAEARAAGLEQIDPAQLGQIMRKTLAGSVDSVPGGMRGPGGRRFSFEEQARCLAAFVSLAELSGPTARAQAMALGATLCTQYRDRSSGLFLAQDGGEEASHAIIDGMLPSAVGAALLALGTLVRWTSDPLFAQALASAKAAYRPVGRRLGRRAAHYWRAVGSAP